MSECKIGSSVTASTRGGRVTGRVVGQEERDVSRFGTGSRIVQMVCVRPQGGGDWFWVRAEHVSQG